MNPAFSIFKDDQSSRVTKIITNAFPNRNFKLCDDISPNDLSLASLNLYAYGKIAV